MPSSRARPPFAQSPVGILAGRGSLPVELMQALKEEGRSVKVVLLDDDPEHVAQWPGATVVNFGRVGAMVQAFKAAGCKDILIAGSVRRPDLMTLKPDLGFFRALPTVVRLMRAGGDDAVLRGVVAFFARQGLRVIGPVEVAPRLVVRVGPLPGTEPPEDDTLALAQRGFDLLRALSPYDVGQAAVVSKDGFEAIEGAEGTDGMLRRVAEARQRETVCTDNDTGPPTAKQTGGGGGLRGEPRGILVKCAKANQDLRVDLPVIGPDTVIGAVQADLAGIITEAGRVLALGRQDLITRATAAQICVAGLPAQPVAASGPGPSVSSSVRSGEQNLTVAESGAPGESFQVKRLGRRRISKSDVQDIQRAACAGAAIDPFDCGRVVVIANGHILAVGASESALATLRRSAKLRQWGERRWRRRSGFAVIAASREATSEFILAAKQAGLAGFAVRPQKFALRLDAETIAAANKHGLAVAELW